MIFHGPAKLLGRGDRRPFDFRLDVVPELVYEVHDHVVLLDADAVEVFPHSERKVVFALSASLSAAHHRGGVDADTARLCQDPLVVGVGEGRRCVQAVLATVGVEDGTFEGSPLKLEEETSAMLFVESQGLIDLREHGGETHWR